MIIAVTGHRPNKLNDEYRYDGPVSRWIAEQIQIRFDKYKPQAAISGLALGVDTIFAMMAISNNISLIAAVPCRDQDCRWKKESQTTYQILLSNASEIVYVHDRHYKTPQDMQDRNIWMVNHCDLLLGFWDGTTGGTHNCLTYAAKVGRITEIIKMEERLNHEMDIS